MPLTPDEVRNKTFTPVRLREGYDMTEVDAFLDEVEAELTRLLQDRPEACADGAGAAPSEPVPVAAGPAVALAEVPPATPAEASHRAARLLEIAAANADQLVEEARTEAEKLRADAAAEVEALTSDARARAERLDAETSERRHELTGDLERERDELARTIDELEAREQDCRRRLRTFFEAQLSILDGNPDGRIALTALGEPETPGRLRELLGDDA